MHCDVSPYLFSSCFCFVFGTTPIYVSINNTVVTMFWWNNLYICTLWTGYRHLVQNYHIKQRKPRSNAMQDKAKPYQTTQGGAKTGRFAIIVKMLYVDAITTRGMFICKISRSLSSMGLLSSIVHIDIYTSLSLSIYIYIYMNARLC